ncbi:hypothetical protein [Methylobacterium oxalidis]|uniref:Uncharacterized protein n=1 Tax=Methylobacterium oxalidis TaxID=944322 RepID=A0A512J4D9_9HYPH|nr:hypothetical protein [Methylobacterium oxalidis]GEP04792.1 hypothetical protein MOX02_28300 [Methylobacterium oxalidis]GJE30490.1 hypothetical protein LDDCCGHA_0658 [Methylobacterium oxalidis]GLS63618.1 hypothetical protein GCM10007888_19990 [Methylobacterium oxalidis]
MTFCDAKNAQVVNEISVAVLSKALGSLIIACEQLNPRVSVHLRPALLAGIRRDLQLIRDAYPVAEVPDQSLSALDGYLRFVVETALADEDLPSVHTH